MPYITYRDQDRTEIYDGWDLESNEPIPKMILQAEIIKDIDPDKNYGSRVVQIDYPEWDGIWSLESEIGRAPYYSEYGKKAFVRKGKYKHPAKGKTSEIVFMEPMEYIEACAAMFSKREDYNITAFELVSGRENNYDLNEVFDGNLIFPPVIEDYGQEGLHRAIWALNKGLKEIPVIVIYKS